MIKTKPSLDSNTSQKELLAMNDIHNDTNKQLLSFSLLLLMIVSLFFTSRIHLWVKGNVSDLLLYCCISTLLDLKGTEE